ncbi:MAG: SPASM domain-containing protein, partial [Candidatus Lokiarchaeia archaeon]
SGIDNIVISTGDLIPKYEAEILGISQELASQKIEGLLKLLEYKEKTKSNINITIGFRAKRSFKEILGTIMNSRFKRFFEKRIFKIDYAFRYDDWCGRISKKDLLGVMRLRRRPLLRKYPCSSLWNISILANGDLRLCGCRVKETEHDELVIGNVLTESLSEIINNEKGRKILSDWVAGEIIETCEDCRRYGFPKYFK